MTDEAKACGLCIEIPRTHMDDAAIAHLRGILETKGRLIAHALGRDSVEIAVTEESISFPWFDEADAGHAHAYSELVSRLCRLAAGLGRVNAGAEKTVANEKYAFRCFLIRLGFVGDEFKADRKILLRNLSGSSAFRDGGRK